MLRRSDPRLLAGLLGAALLLTGCAGATQPPEPAPSPTHIDLGAWDEESGGNGLMLLDAAAARATMLGAVRDAGSTTMTGTFTTAAGRVLTVDVSGSNEQTVAELTLDGATTTVVIDGGQAYVRPSTATASDGLTADAFACVDDDDPALTRWNPLLHPLQTLAQYTDDASGLGAASEGTVDLIMGADGTLGALSVQTEGPALPVSLTRADAAGALQLEFTDWGGEIALPDVGSPAGC